MDSSSWKLNYLSRSMTRDLEYTASRQLVRRLAKKILSETRLMGVGAQPKPEAKAGDVDDPQRRQDRDTHLDSKSVEPRFHDEEVEESDEGWSEALPRQSGESRLGRRSWRADR